MIFPIFNFKLSDLNPYAVFYLLSINIIVFLFLTFYPEQRKDLSLKSETVQTYGLYYWKFLNQECENQKYIKICKDARFGNFKNQNNSVMNASFFNELGEKALLNNLYLKIFFEYPHQGDPVQLKQLNEEMKTWKTAFEKSQSVIFGSQAEDSHQSKRIIKMFTYQFTHTGIFHLLGNMFFLFAFGCALSAILTQVQLFGIYLCGGICGILFQHFLIAESVIPVIGASASVCALIPIYLLLESKNNIRYFYFFAPIHPYFGTIYFSKWWLILFLIVPDITGVIEGLTGNTSTAHFAHLGGMIFGLVMGLYFKFTTPRFSRFIKV
jgi:membrane associated rhomboid family serine protease